MAALIVLGVSVATLSRSIRVVILSLWLVGLVVGAIYSSIGAEVLGFMQLAAATLTSVSFYFFSMIFGGEIESNEKEGVNHVFKQVLILIFSSFYSLILGFGFHSIVGKQAPVNFQFSKVEMNLLGEKLINEYVISFELIVVTFFLILIGGGVLARPEKVDEVERI